MADVGRSPDKTHFAACMEQRPPSPADLAEFFRTRKVGFDRCLEPLMQCAETAIRAHSIQNRQTISLLQNDNHVLAWQPRFSRAGPEVRLRMVGRNEASTFSGFCSQHDTTLFRPLDTKPLDIADQEQLFLLAYRAITCELHAIMTGVMQLQTLYTARADRGVDVADETSHAGQKAVEQMLLSWATWRYRFEYYDQPMLSGAHGDVVHEVITFGGQAPCLAASSFITVKDVPVAENLVGVAINILPVSPSRTVAVFSCARQHQASVRAALNRVLGAIGDTQKYELSKLVLSRISNVLFAPAHVAKWRPGKAEKIVAAFVGTVRTQQDVGDDVDFMLF
jgi:hypothetical protein